MMERTTMPTWRVSCHRRTAKVVPRAKRASVNLHMTKTMLTMSGRHHRRKAEAFLLTKKRKSSKKRKTRSNDPFEKDPCLDRSPGPTREVSCARMMEPEIHRFLSLLSSRLDDIWKRRGLYKFSEAKLRCTTHGLLQRAELFRSQPLRERS